MNKIDFGTFRRLNPISRSWGFDRGTPIDRYYIESFLDHNSGRILGRVLEIKDRNYTLQFGGDRVVQSDVLDIDPANSEATYIADITRAEHLEPNQFDSIIFTQTLQLISKPEAALRTLHSILRPGGALLLTCPGITRIENGSRDGKWFWAFTPTSLSMLLESVFGDMNYAVAAHGSVFTATCFLWGISLEEIKQSELDYHDPDYPVLLTAVANKN